MFNLKKYFKFIDNKPSKVSLPSRIIAYLLDWAIGGIFTGLPAVVIYALVTGKSDMFSDLYVFKALGYPSYWGYIAGVLCLVFGVFYYFIVPYAIYPGQTIGKKIMKLKIVNLDGSLLKLKTLIIRQVVFVLILEGVAFVFFAYLRQLLTLITGYYLESILGIVFGFITILSAMLCFGSPSQRSIHDYCLKTRVALVDEPIKEIKKKKKKK